MSSSRFLGPPRGIPSGDPQRSSSKEPCKSTPKTPKEFLQSSFGFVLRAICTLRPRQPQTPENQKWGTWIASGLIRRSFCKSPKRAHLAGSGPIRLDPAPFGRIGPIWPASGAEWDRIQKIHSVKLAGPFSNRAHSANSGLIQPERIIFAHVLPTS